MPPFLRTLLAFFAGLSLGSLLNMALILVSGKIIPAPIGVDNTTTEGLKAGLHLFEPKHFIFPFLAHALGTFSGAAFAAWIAISHKMGVALAVGVFFFAGGLGSILLLPSPLWFTVIDLTGAYFPMAYLGGKMVKAKITPWQS